jgi:hypothetical protein
LGSTLLQFGNWLQNTRIALNIAGSTWAYAYVQALHFCGLSLFVGTNLALDASLLGIGKAHQTPAEISEGFVVWNWIGFCIAITGGLLLFAASAATYVINPPFLIKVGILIPTALIVHITVQIKVRGWCKTPQLPKIAKLAGFGELLLWLSVATAAVLIPYYA